ncbi:hypothetical protein HQN90_14220 [Paenibacillus alba]|uniref:hypothetical protein n=1 Tax=Paenibacillus alba TaxID=1197127 RepID=UPI00156541F2|nr:hypothetical protein [Paenibacillus alba]NQX67273.1 hypothetical protein [Paenibacillus alba]
MENTAASFGNELTTSLQRYFATSIRGSVDDLFPYSAAELLDEASRSPILRQQSAQLGDPECRVVGTLFAKRYSVFVMGLFAAISLFDTPLAASPEIVRFRVTSAGAMAYETEFEDSPRMSTWHHEERRVKLVDYVLQLQSHLQHIFAAISASTGASIKVMWSLVSHNLRNLYTRLEADESLWRTTERLRLILADRDVLFEPTSGNVFAVKLHLFEHPEWQGAPLLLRGHCCLAYKIQHGSESHGYCISCPQLRPEERLAMLLA